MITVLRIYRGRFFFVLKTFLKKRVWNDLKIKDYTDMSLNMEAAG
jgi:hypothetical protein